jgi:hypothetical protein
MIDTPDVAAIMAGVRASIARRRSLGYRTPEEIARVGDERLRAYGERSGIDPKLLALILHPSHDWNIAAEYPLRTERTGLIAAAILTAKRLVRPFVRLYTDHIVKRQAQLNLYLMYFLQDTVHRVNNLEADVARLREELEERGPRSSAE